MHVQNGPSPLHPANYSQNLFHCHHSRFQNQATKNPYRMARVSNYNGQFTRVHHQCSLTATLLCRTQEYSPTITRSLTTGVSMRRNGARLLLELFPLLPLKEERLFGLGRRCTFGQCLLDLLVLYSSGIYHLEYSRSIVAVVVHTHSRFFCIILFHCLYCVSVLSRFQVYDCF